ncbi:MAG: DNA polymerase I, partial [Planctomycetota bacterium]|nr:DNA polymerase I [Planctomycetota bacterium]
TTQDGHPTAATYGFCMTLRALIEREQPDAIAIAFDGPRSDLLRTKIYPEYKSTRTKMPEEMAVQLDDIRASVEAFGLPVVSAEEHEADDVIGTLAVRGRALDMDVFIVTGDKDFLQIVDDRVKLWNLRSSTSSPEIFDPAACEAKWGLPPSAIVDMLALMGDSSDNVPGVPKIGKKTAVDLLTQFGSIEGIYERLEEVKKPSIKKTLEENRELAELSRQLVTLQLDLPLAVEVSDLGPAAPDPEKLRPLFQRLDFKNLLSDLAANKAPQQEVAQRYAVVDSDEALRALAADLSQRDQIAVAAETAGATLRKRKLVGISFATEPGVATYVPLTDDNRAARVEALRAVLAAESPTKHVHDLKRMLASFRALGVELGGVGHDTMLASYCSDPGLRSHGLADLALKHFAFKKTAAKDIVGSGKKQRTFAEVDAALVGAYVSEEADLVMRLVGPLQAQLEQAGTLAIYREMEVPLVPALLDMEWEGIAVDTDHLKALSEELQERIEGLQDRVFERVGHEFNLGSPAQLGKVLFDELEVHRAADINKPRRTPTGQYKTDQEVLVKVAAKHEVPKLVLEWRQLTKLKSTYIDSLPALVQPDSGRVHTTFNQAVAATGRLSSEDPNLQNIPIRTEEGRRVRAAFVPRTSGWSLISADYSQIELRILAHLSEDKALVESFQKGEDIHARTAAIVHGILPNLVTPELRNQAKIVNYGLMYGMGASRLANETGMRPPEAKKFIKSYFRALPGVKAYLDASLDHARTEREARTMFGRRRPLGDIDSTNAMQRIAAENMAVNTPIQGAAADIVKRAMLAVHDALSRRGLQAKLLLQVHDELVLDVPDDERTEVERLLRDAMVGAAELKVPLEVTMGSGANWLIAH